jgi:hypothetical protein
MPMPTASEGQPLSVEEQLNVLRPTIPFAARMHQWLLVGASGSALLAAILWNPAPLLIAAFLAVVALAERRAGPNLVAALRAYDTGAPEFGEVRITLSEGDSANHYHASVRGGAHPEWRYDFVPQGWQPAEGEHAARIWRAGPEGRPVLAVVEGGILIPRSLPRRGAV